MRIDEKYKRLIKCFFSVVMILLLTVTYHQFWVRYYNKIILYPFYRRGMWMMAGIYAAMLIFFMNAYGGFKIGYLRKGNLIYSQALSLIFTNIFTYFQLSVLDKKSLVRIISYPEQTAESMVLDDVVSAFVCKCLSAKENAADFRRTV